MKYDFDKIIDRRGTNSYKWDTPEEDGVIPMWVADMDFCTAPAVVQAVTRRAQHGIYGYVTVPEAYYQATIDWFGTRHHWDIERDWILYTSGVVPAISAIIKAFTNPGDKVVVQQPVYNCFFSSIVNNGCEIVDNALIATGDTYVMDYDDLEEKTKDARVKLLLLCNPHNPAGRVWSKEELSQVGKICAQNHVIVVSDEIHCELTMPGYDYMPFASISPELQDRCITCVSPSKAFNTAGLQIANIVTNHPDWRKKIDRAINDNEVCDVNPFGVEALIAAYNQGADWLEELRQYLWENYNVLKQYFAQHLPFCQVTKLEATYLVWVDIKSTGLSSDQLTHLLLTEGKVMVNSGTIYGKAQGEGYMRINIACPRARMLEGLKRMAHVINRHVQNT